MRLIGSIGSNATFQNAWAILRGGEEKDVHHEDLCLIKNLNGNEIIAVIRDGRAIDENLNTQGFSPGTSRIREGLNVPSARRQDIVFLDGIGETPPLRQNRTLICPQSNVLVFEDSDNPIKYLTDSETDPNLGIGHYHGHKNWKIPVKPGYISYHTGVYGATGCGKTMFISYALIPMLRQAGYHILIFDWKGSKEPKGYSRILPDNVVKWSEISMDKDLIISYLCSLARDFGYTGEKKNRNPIREALEETIYSSDFDEIFVNLEGSNEISLDSILSIFNDKMRNHITLNHLDANGQLGTWGKRHIRRFEKYFRNVKSKDLKLTMGKEEPSNILWKTLNMEQPMVIDLGGLSRHQKISIFLAFDGSIRQEIERGEKLRLAVILDEAPQYAPWKPTGLQIEATDAINNLCATGRDAELAVVIASQGIAGEIGINASIRRNLNTQFIGQTGAADLSTNEVKQLIKTMNLSSDFLLGMKGPEGERLFYFSGAMNPSPKPLLISFEIPDELKAEKYV